MVSSEFINVLFANILVKENSCEATYSQTEYCDDLVTPVYNLPWFSFRMVISCLGHVRGEFLTVLTEAKFERDQGSAPDFQ